jgi:hypothetical protein
MASGRGRVVPPSHERRAVVSIVSPASAAAAAAAVAAALAASDENASHERMAVFQHVDGSR